MLDLCRQDRRLGHVLFAAADAVAGFGEEAALAGAGDRRANHFAFADQFAGEACAVPPFSLDEQRRISEFPQFSTMVCASPCP